MITSILSIEDVKNFARLLTSEKVSFHPDDDFHDYIDLVTGLKHYSDEEATHRNELMDNCFRVCEETGDDIYSIMGDVYLIETGMDKFIPTSTSEPK